MLDFFFRKKKNYVAGYICRTKRKKNLKFFFNVSFFFAKENEALSQK